MAFVHINYANIKKSALVFLLVPFFSVANETYIDPTSPNIFTNGTVQSVGAGIEACALWKYASDFSSCEFSADTALSAFNATNQNVQNGTYYGCEVFDTEQITATSIKAKISCKYKVWSDYFQRYEENTYSGGQSVGTYHQTTEQEKCPPDPTDPTYSQYTYSWTDRFDNMQCAKPSQISLVDSCNASSGNTVLNLQVTDANACHTAADGSVCEYNAVDVGGGNQVYEMDLEGDCYTDPTKPDITNNAQIGSEPVNECVNNGGLLACPADPDLVCNSTNSTLDGGTISSCNPSSASCGYVNGSFVCYDVDTDSDGLPDYNDPDIDGDGIKNEDDLDSDGDGKDDPIDQNQGSGSGGGNTTVNVDMSGVESKLTQIKDKLTYTTTTQTADKTKYNDLFNDTKKQALQDEVDQLKQDISDWIDTTKVEAASLVNISVPTAAGYQARAITFTHSNVDVSLNRFNDFFVALAAPVMLVCSLIAAFILLGGGKD